MSRPDWFTLIAKERGVPDGWAWFKSEWRGETDAHGVFLVTGGVNGGVFKSGKNKGKPNPKLRTDVRELVISRDDMKAIKAKWSAETGLCAPCFGEGVRTVSISTEHGRKTRPCADCNGNGKVAP